MNVKRKDLEETLPQGSTIVKLPNGFVITIDYSEDQTELRHRITKADGKDLEDAGGFFFDRSNGNMYDPLGRLAEFTFENANSGTNFGSGVPDEALSPLGYATEASANRVVEYLAGWFPSWSMSLTSIPQVGTPDFQRMVQLVPPNRPTFQVNAGLMASLIMRDPTTEKASAKPTVISMLAREAHD